VTTHSVCLLPKLKGIGGPSVFQMKIRQGLEQHGVSVHFDPNRTDCASILVIGGTNQLVNLWRAKKRGVRIVQRLDGINWLHRLRPTGLRHYLRSERNNLVLATIRHYLADHIVYQSVFTHDWWQNRYQNVNSTSQVIYNGVDLQIFTPLGSQHTSKDLIRLLVIEGSFSGGHDRDLYNAVELAWGLRLATQKRVELLILGQTPRNLITPINSTYEDLVHWEGVIPYREIPAYYRSAHLFFPAEINAACPNTVIEAFACGLPVIAYATGSLPELIQGDAGRTAPYGANYWKLEPPEPQALIQAALEILSNQPRFRKAARAHAEKHFSLEKMTEEYLAALRI